MLVAATMGPSLRTGAHLTEVDVPPVDAAMEKLGFSEHTVAAPADIGTVAGCESAVETAIESFGGLDVLVNNAGVGAGRPIADCDEEMYDAHADVNLKGLFFC